MKTDNELIAEFMGGKWETVWYGGIETKAFNFPKWHITDWPHQIHEDTFQYKTSWDWLMPVCKKWDCLNLLDSQDYIELCDKLDNAVSCYDINPVFEQLVHNIKWYNSNKS